jgi:hypothetical protein
MTDQVDNQDNTASAPEPTQNEVEARQSGWVPKEEFQGDENKWVDADEFVRRGPLFKKIDIQTRELKEVKKALDQLKIHHASVKETAYKEALEALKAEKKAAYIDGDPDKIIELDDRIAEVKEEKRRFDIQRAEEVKQVATQELNPEFVAWTSRNTWYDNSKPMRAFADALGVELHANGMSPSQVLREVERQVKEEFPNKFRNANRDKAPTVEGASKGGGKSNSGGFELSAMEKSIMERFVRQKIMTADEYIAEIKKTRKDD